MELFRRAMMAVRAADAAYEAWTDRYGTVLGFAVLFCGPALGGYHSALVQAAQASCGAGCLAMPGFYVLAAAGWGVVAVLAAMVYARLLYAFQRQSARKKNLAEFGWVILGMAVTIFSAVGSQHGYASGALLLGWFHGGLGGPGMRGALDFFWSEVALEQASSPDT
jgi:hypothetical protein